MAPLEGGVLFFRGISMKERGGDMQCAKTFHCIGGEGGRSGGRRQVRIGKGIGGMID